MNWKAVGVETGKIYATGSHADCVRVINERISNNDWHMDGTRSDLIIKHDEAIRMIQEGQHIETEAEWNERMEKECRIMNLQAKKTRDRTAPTNPVKWTQEKDDFILENSNMNNTDLSDFFNEAFNEQSSLSSIRNRLHKLRSDRGIDLTKGVIWKPDEDDYLLTNHQNKSVKEIADHLGRTKGAVASRISIFVMQGLLERKKRR